MNAKEFLNPNSMLTPGIAGGVTMIISNSLWVQFALTQKWTALVLSFVLGLLVLVNMRAAIWQKGIYYILNSLIIFTIGVGANTIGIGNVAVAAPPEPEARAEQPSVSGWLIPQAHAQNVRHRPLRADRTYASSAWPSNEVTAPRQREGPTKKRKRA